MKFSWISNRTSSDLNTIILFKKLVSVVVHITFFSYDGVEILKKYIINWSRDRKVWEPLIYDFVWHYTGYTHGIAQ